MFEELAETQRGVHEMRFPATILRTADGRWSARHQSQEWGLLEATADTPQQAAEKLRGEIRYRLELCPCSGQMYQDIQIVIANAESE